MGVLINVFVSVVLVVYLVMLMVGSFLLDSTSEMSSKGEHK